MRSSAPGSPGLLARLLHSLRELGPLGAVIHCGDYVLAGLSVGRCRLRGYALIAQPLGQGELVSPADKGCAAVQEVARGDPLMNDFPRTAEVNQQRWLAGASCLAATVKGAFAGTVWIARGSHVEDEVRCVYNLADPAHSVWDFDLYLAPRYRGGRMFARLWQAVDGRLAAEGIQWTFSRISLLNPASLAAHKRLNAQRVGTALFLTLGPLQLAVFSRAPFVHLSINSTSRPAVSMRAPRQAAAPSATSSPARGAVPGGSGAAQPESPPVALVLGLDSHGLAVARALAEAGVVVYALEPNPATPGAVSNRVRRCFGLQDFSEPNLLAALRRVRKQLQEHPRVVLLAINDRQVTAVSHHLDELQSLYLISWAEQAPTILKLQRKDELEAFSIAQGLRYPKSALFVDTQPPAAGHGLQFPVILKPVQPLSSFKTLIAQDDAQLLQHLDQHRGALPILAQEYVPGGDTSIYFGALMLDRGRVLHGMAGRKIMSHPPARGQTTIAETVDAPDVIELTEQFFRGTQLSGPVSLELKRDPQGRYWVIEPTVGRTDFWAELCIGAGFNQPLIEFELAAGLPPTPARAMTPCVWYDTERDPLAWLRLSWAEKTPKPRQAQQRFPYHGHGDLRPLLRALKRLAQGRLNNLWSRHRAADPPVGSA